MRREFITTAFCAVAWPFEGLAQTSRVPCLGFLGLGQAAEWKDQIEALRAGSVNLAVEVQDVHGRRPVAAGRKAKWPIDAGLYLIAFASTARGDTRSASCRNDTTCRPR